MRDEKRKLAERWRFRVWRTCGEDRARATPHGVVEACPRIAPALPDFGSSKGVLSGYREWIDENTRPVIISAEMRCLCFNGGRVGVSYGEREHGRK
jgi:hypothetical protein